jgi:hypothetical protein
MYGSQKRPCVSGVGPAPRDVARPIFHVADLADDLFRYDDERCHTLISRITGVDGMTPGYALPFARAITSPVFTGWGDVDVSSDPHAEPAAYTNLRHVTTPLSAPTARWCGWRCSSSSGLPPPPGTPLVLIRWSNRMPSWAIW